MPVRPTYPGLYIDELPLSAHSISAAPTSVAAFIGYSHPYRTKEFGKAVRIFSFTDFEREFGGLFASGLADPGLGHAVNQFFMNGGSDAYVVGLEPHLYAADGSVAGSFGSGGHVYTAQIATDVGHGILLTGKELADVVAMKAVVTNVRASALGVANSVFDLIITYGSTIETYRGIDLAGTGNNQPDTLINARSSLVTASLVGGAAGANMAAAAVTLDFVSPALPAGFVSTFNGSDYTDALQADSSLDKVEIFNLLILPGVTDNSVVSSALSFAERKRAFMIVDPPYGSSADGADGLPEISTVMGTVPRSQNGAIYFPWLLSTDPVRGVIEPMPPSGFVAGVYARTDSSRGVWKAPAGIAANVLNTIGPVQHGRMNDQRHGVLNENSINALRNFAEGTVVFGARTLVADNSAYPQSKYVPVRRMTLFIEQTLISNLRWVVFEPNDWPLWTAIRSSVSNFMLSLFNQQALAGAKPSEAFQVKCDATTTTPDDQANGIVNIVVAFAPLKPAEFVIIKIAQLAGQNS